MIILLTIGNTWILLLIENYIFVRKFWLEKMYVVFSRGKSRFRQKMNFSKHFVWTFWHSACRKSRSQSDPSGMDTCGSLLWSHAFSCFSLSLSSISFPSDLSLCLSASLSLLSLLSLLALNAWGKAMNGIWMESEWILDAIWQDTTTFVPPKAGRVDPKTVLIGTYRYMSRQVPSELAFGTYVSRMNKYRVLISLFSLSVSLCLLFPLSSVFSLFLRAPSSSGFFLTHVWSHLAMVSDDNMCIWIHLSDSGQRQRRKCAHEIWRSPILKSWYASYIHPCYLHSRCDFPIFR